MPLSSDYLRVHPFANQGNSTGNVTPTVDYAWLEEVDALTGTPDALETIPTVGLPPRARRDIYIGTPSVLQSWFLVSGAADTTDPTGQVAPLDYNVSTNNVHWVKGL